MSLAATPLLLNYDQTQRRWDRQLSYLLGIICVLQVLMLPQYLLQIMEHLHMPAAAFGPPGFAFRLTFFQELELLISSVCTLFLVPLTSVLIALACFLLIFNLRWPRYVLIPAAWLQLFALVLIVLPALSRSFEAYPFYVPIGEHLYDERAFAELQILASLAYPLVLLLLVLRQHATRIQAARSSTSRASILWRVTVGACILFVVPTIYDWCLHPSLNMAETTRDVYAIILGETPSNTFRGIGEACLALAAFALFPLLLYARFRGPRGRHALLICAALLLVAAVAPAAAAFRAFSMSWRYLHLTSDLWYTIQRSIPTATILTYFAAAAAFPLCLRLALSLQELRGILDAQSTADSPASTPEPPTTPACLQSPTLQTPAQSTHSPS